MSNPTPSVERRADRAADAVWRRLCSGLSESWLDDIRVLRTGGDDFESSLNIWSAGLTVELKDPERREKASMVVSRLRKLADQIENSLGS